jgi:hypothetical protein
LAQVLAQVLARVRAREIGDHAALARVGLTRIKRRCDRASYDGLVGVLLLMGRLLKLIARH